MAGRKPNSTFQFKQFTIQQDRCAMKVGTDGVLLGAWVQPGTIENVLDVGTGTGLIAIMLAQKCHALIDAVEIDESAARQARENADDSPWSERIRIYPSSFEEYASVALTRYQLIVSNPPYFSRSFKPPQPGRILARHSESLSMTTLIGNSVKLLHPEGRLTLVLPCSEDEKCMELTTSAGLYCKRKLVVYPKPGMPAKRILVEFSRQAGMCMEQELFIETENRHAWSESYKELTREFYLKF